MSETLYHRLLRRDFDRLPPVLRRFHGASEGGRATGVLRVRSSGGWLSRLLQRLLGLPPAGAQVEVALCVRPTVVGETWERDFGTRVLRTTQWIEDGRLIERVDGVELAFDVRADDEGMRFAPAGARWLGIPLPRALTPRVAAEVRGLEDGWEVRVVVRVPYFGVVSDYSGRITPTP